jgi:hypothetical protein
MMGVETSLPLFAMDAAAPKGAPPRRPQLPDFLETVLAPRGALMRGDFIKLSLIFHNFHGPGVNSLFMPVSLEQTFFLKR